MPSRLEVLTEDTLTEDEAAELERRLGDEYAWADEAQAEARAMGYGRVVTDADKEAIGALRAAPPIREPVRLTRQSARRLAMQVAWAQLRESGLSRRERRRLWHELNFSALARRLVAVPTLPRERTPAEAGTPSAR